MTIWKYTDAKRDVVWRQNPDGSQESILASALPEGTEVLPADPPAPPSPAAEIDRLERETLLPRPVRDVLLALMVKEAAAMGVDEPTLYAVNPGYRRVRDLDNQIAALRSQL